jgi:hypothetical protein
MPRDQNLKRQRDRQILREFEKQYRQGYRPAVIYERLSERWFLRPHTIEDIVYKTARAEEHTR